MSTPGPSVVVSLDAELRWGFHDFAEIPEERVSNARDGWLDLLEVFETFDVPATWAIVGHLFLEECSGDHEGHPAGPEWFARDSGGSFAPGSEWFGPDLVEAVIDSDVDHDVGSHTFSHVEFADPEPPADVVDAELRLSREAAEEYGVELSSFVFPRNRVGHREALAEHGFTCYRGSAPDRWYEGTPIRSAGKLATFALDATAPPIVSPSVDEYGLVDVPASMYLFEFEGGPRDAIQAVSRDPVVRQVELGLERVSERGEGILHLWLHPNNVTGSKDLERMRAIASLLARYRNRHGVDVETMAGVAERVRTTEGTAD